MCLLLHLVKKSATNMVANLAHTMVFYCIGDKKCYGCSQHDGDLLAYVCFFALAGNG